MVLTYIIGMCAAQAVIKPTQQATADPYNRARAASDLHMMLMFGSRERDAEQWRSLLAAAGFSLGRIVPTRSMFSIVEATPVPVTV